MLLIDYYLDKKLSWKIVIEKLPFFILSLAFGIAGIYFLSEQKSLLVSEFKVVDGILVGCLAYVIYIIKFFIPYRMSPMYPFDTILSWEYYVAPVGVLLILIIVYYAYRNKVYWLVTGIGIFTVNVIFLLQIVRAGQGMFADRFTYIPYLGLIFLVVYLIDRIVKHSLQRVKTVYASSSVFLLIFSILSWQQIGVWENGGTLWTHVLKYYPNTTTPWQNRSLYYSDNKKYDLALKDIDKALSLHSDMSVSYTCRAKIYFNLQGYQDAINDYDSAIIYEATPECYINRGIAYCALKEYDKGLEDISHGISINPDQATLKNGYRNLGKAYYETQKFEKSIENYNNFITIEPNVGEIWYNKGLSERMFNKPEDAVNSLNKAIKLVPDNGLYYRERAICWLMLGDKAKGRQDVMMAEKYGMKVEELLKEKLM
jgi:tetratricopeptide (TPR) repeat protein